MRAWIILLVLLLAIDATGVAARATDYTKPKVRAITAFVRLDHATYTQQVKDTLAVLGSAKGELEKHGYQVTTVRIVTQPLAELIAGLSDAEAFPLPGDVSEAQIARILGDVAALAWKWHKPLAARLLPVKGKKAGDTTGFQDQYLFNTTLHGLP